MKWVGIRLEVELGEGIVFVRRPLVLAGDKPPGAPGSLTLRLGNRVRFAPGVVIEAEPGKTSVLEIGDGTRIGATSHFELDGGSIRVGANSELRDGCVLRTTDGEIELKDRSFVGYGCLVHATEGVVLSGRVTLADRAALVDSLEDQLDEGD
jgi:acetyltransferase-like isoleucine patch superfamily enzyme